MITRLWVLTHPHQNLLPPKCMAVMPSVKSSTGALLRTCRPPLAITPPASACVCVRTHAHLRVCIDFAHEWTVVTVTCPVKYRSMAQSTSQWVGSVVLVLYLRFHPHLYLEGQSVWAVAVGIGAPLGGWSFCLLLVTLSLKHRLNFWIIS